MIPGRGPFRLRSMTVILGAFRHEAYSSVREELYDAPRTQRAMQWHQRVTDSSINCLREIAMAGSPWKIRPLHTIAFMLLGVH
jgi:hypothetical protein